MLFPFLCDAPRTVAKVAALPVDACPLCNVHAPSASCALTLHRKDAKAQREREEKLEIEDSGFLVAMDAESMDRADAAK
jgi:hypothetical protein